MTELELHLIRQRMASGRLAKAGRGELAVPLPAGYARRPSGEVALDPDEQVQAVVRLVFGLFEQLGTVHAVLRFLVGHQVRIGMRERSGPGKGEVVWRAPHQQGLVNMLRNPAYAGIYAYGRSRTDRSRRLPGHEHSGRVRALDAGQWLLAPTKLDGSKPRPDLRPVGACTTGNIALTAPGYLFTAPNGQGRGGPTIYADDGSVVWTKPRSVGDEQNFQVLNVGGRKLLAYYHGAWLVFGVETRGEFVLLDEHYRELGAEPSHRPVRPLDAVPLDL